MENRFNPENETMYNLYLDELQSSLKHTLDKERRDRCRTLIEQIRDCELRKCLRNLGKQMAYTELKYLGYEDLIPKQKNNEMIYFLTISFFDNIEIIPKAIDIVNNKFITMEYLRNTRYVYAFEQRSINKDDIYGLHMHMIFDKKRGDDYKKSRLINRIYNTFKNVCSKNCIDLRIYPADFREDKIKYISGDKWDADKLPKVEVDKYMREIYNLKELYNE